MQLYNDGNRMTGTSGIGQSVTIKPTELPTKVSSAVVDESLLCDEEFDEYFTIAPGFRPKGRYSCLIRSVVGPKPEKLNQQRFNNFQLKNPYLCSLWPAKSVLVQQSEDGNNESKGPLFCSIKFSGSVPVRELRDDNAQSIRASSFCSTGPSGSASANESDDVNVQTKGPHPICSEKPSGSGPVQESGIDVSSIQNADIPASFSNTLPTHKMKRSWRIYGFYTSIKEMDEVRKRERVSKRKSVTTFQGTKVFYRCNNWRRTNCDFRMYAIISTPHHMGLFASGEHDHTAKDTHYVTKTPNVEGESIAPVPILSQQEVINRFVDSVTQNLPPVDPPELTKETPIGDSAKQSSDMVQCSEAKANKAEMDLFENCKTLQCDEVPYQLLDEQRLLALLQVSNDMNHTLSYDERTGEFCFEPNDPNFNGRSVVILDASLLILVIERLNGVEQSCEIWVKSDWKQFLWAIRGKCMRIYV